LISISSSHREAASWWTSRGLALQGGALQKVASSGSWWCVDTSKLAKKKSQHPGEQEVRKDRVHNRDKDRHRDKDRDKDKVKEREKEKEQPMAHQHNVPAHERRIHELDQNVERVFDVRKVRTSSVQKKSCSIMQIFVLKINFKFLKLI